MQGNRQWNLLKNALVDAKKCPSDMKFLKTSSLKKHVSGHKFQTVRIDGISKQPNSK